MTVTLSLVLSFALGLTSPVAPPSPAGTQTATAGAVTGTVQDPDGAVVAGAVVILRSPSGAEVQSVSGQDGRFSLTMSGSGEVVLFVRTRGFAEVRQTIAAGAPRQDLIVKLTPAS